MQKTFTKIKEALLGMQSVLAKNSMKPRIYLVGGSVRDLILKKKPKDYDFLVTGLTLQEITLGIEKIGKSTECGASFGVVKGNIDGHEFDFAIPRTAETKTGLGHTDFSVTLDPYASVESDLSRRDFTINSIALPIESLIEGTMDCIIDPHNGMNDIYNCSIKAVGEPKDRFSEDPLRILRALQFSSRLRFAIEPKTLAAIIENREDLLTITGERIFSEFKKAWTGDVSLFIENITKTKIGETLFGASFAPIKLNTTSFEQTEKQLLHFISFFLKGGNPSVFKPDTLSSSVLQFAQRLYFSEEHPWKFVGSLTKEQVMLVSKILSTIDNKVIPKMTKLTTIPLKPSDICVSGGEIMHIKQIQKHEGKKIGEIQRAILSALWEGEVVNTHVSINDFLHKC